MSQPFQSDSFTLNEDGVGIFYTSDPNPDINGFNAPMGSLLITPGKLWVKSNTANTDWGLSSTSTTPSFSGFSGFAATTINYTLSNRVLILADTTTNPITIYLPVASTLTNMVYHIKWHKGAPKNKVTLLPVTGEFLDGESSQIMGELGDNLEIVSIGTEWVII